MKHLNPVNRKAARVEQVTAPAGDVVALQQGPPQQVRVDRDVDALAHDAYFQCLPP